MNHIAILDLHVEKGFRLSGSGRVSAFVDVFNVLNANPEVGTGWSVRGLLPASAPHRRGARRTST